MVRKKEIPITENKDKMKSLKMKQNIFDKVLLQVSKKKVENKKKATSINKKK